MKDKIFSTVVFISIAVIICIVAFAFLPFKELHFIYNEF